ncbi:MAG: hypothetical protein MK212_07710 [Saprospiraceae bacterium]|nr:hypothetical protein [Saprospiraceae bacterium]
MLSCSGNKNTTPKKLTNYEAQAVANKEAVWTKRGGQIKQRTKNVRQEFLVPKEEVNKVSTLADIPKLEKEYFLESYSHVLEHEILTKDGETVSSTNGVRLNSSPKYKLSNEQAKLLATNNFEVDPSTEWIDKNAIACRQEQYRYLNAAFETLDLDGNRDSFLCGNMSLYRRFDLAGPYHINSRYVKEHPDLAVQLFVYADLFRPLRYEEFEEKKDAEEAAKFRAKLNEKGNEELKKSFEEIEQSMKRIDSLKTKLKEALQ